MAADARDYPLPPPQIETQTRPHAAAPSEGEAGASVDLRVGTPAPRLAHHPAYHRVGALGYPHPYNQTRPQSGGASGLHPYTPSRPHPYGRKG